MFSLCPNRCGVLYTACHFYKLMNREEYFYSPSISWEPKPKDHEVKWLLRGPQGSTCWKWDLNPGLSGTEVYILNHGTISGPCTSCTILCDNSPLC